MRAPSHAPVPPPPTAHQPGRTTSGVSQRPQPLATLPNLPLPLPFPNPPPQLGSGNLLTTAPPPPTTLEASSSRKRAASSSEVDPSETRDQPSSSQRRKGPVLLSTIPSLHYTVPAPLRAFSSSSVPLPSSFSPRIDATFGRTNHIPIDLLSHLKSTKVIHANTAIGDLSVDLWDTTDALDADAPIRTVVVRDHRAGRAQKKSRDQYHKNAVEYLIKDENIDVFGLGSRTTAGAMLQLRRRFEAIDRIFPNPQTHFHKLIPSWTRVNNYQLGRSRGYPSFLLTVPSGDDYDVHEALEDFGSKYLIEATAATSRWVSSDSFWRNGEQHPPQEWGYATDPSFMAYAATKLGVDVRDWWRLMDVTANEMLQFGSNPATPVISGRPQT